MDRIEGVDCIASGYEWECPECNMLNGIPSFVEDQECAKCGQKVKLSMPEHACD